MSPRLPTIAVALTAYRRAHYLPAAFASVAAQTLPPDSVHVAADEGACGADAVIAGLGVRAKWSRVEGAAQGPRLAALVRASEGADVLAFLDDDDLWEPGKLAHVAAAFTTDDRLAFLNHAHTEFTDSGVPPRRPAWRLLRDLRGGFTRLAGVPYYGGASTIAVRRAALLPYLDTLARVDLAADDALFWLAGEAGGRSLALRAPLARLRIHDGNSSRPSDAVARRTLAERRLWTYAMLSTVVRGERRAAFERRFDEIGRAVEVAAR